MRRTGTRQLTVVPSPGCDTSEIVPSISETRSRMPISPKPSAPASGSKPTPSSLTAMSTKSGVSATRTVNRVARACLTAFVVASWTSR